MSTGKKRKSLKKRKPLKRRVRMAPRPADDGPAWWATVPEVRRTLVLLDDQEMDALRQFWDRRGDPLLVPAR